MFPITICWRETLYTVDAKVITYFCCAFCGTAQCTHLAAYAAVDAAETFEQYARSYTFRIHHVSNAVDIYSKQWIGKIWKEIISTCCSTCIYPVMSLLHHQVAGTEPIYHHSSFDHGKCLYKTEET